MLTRIREAAKREAEGFTLIELLVVVIIIGILAAIAIPVFLNQRKKAVDAQIKSDIHNAATAFETASVDNPTSTTAFTGAEAGTNGWKGTTGDVLTISGSPGNGYCIKGENPNATGGSTAFFWYDSKNGGLQPGGSSATAPAAATVCSAASAASFLPVS